jgi:hypothetical protein
MQFKTIMPFLAIAGLAKALAIPATPGESWQALKS